MNTPTFVYLPDSRRYLNLANITTIITRKTAEGVGFTVWMLTDGTDHGSAGNQVDVDGITEADTLSRALRHLTINTHEVTP